MRIRRTRLIAATLTPIFIAGCSLGDNGPSQSTSGASTSTKSHASPSASQAPPAVTTAVGVDAASWAGVDAAGRQVAGTVALVAGVVKPSGQLQIVHQSGPKDVQPIASVTKLYVMIALLDAIDAGTMTWDRILTVQAADRAGGSGSLGGRGVGVQVSVQQAARMMFQISDNTATSLLVRTLGQDAMAKAVSQSGHSRPDLLKPFLTIREDLWLVYSPSAEAAAARAAWPSADQATRAQLVATAHGPAGDGQLGAAHLAVGIGYYATAVDVARAWVAIADRIGKLGARAGEASTLMQVPSQPFSSPQGWKTVWFKSGAIGAAQNGAWYSPGAKGGQVLVVLTTGGSEAGVRRFASTAAAQLDQYAATHP